MVHNEAMAREQLMTTRLRGVEAALCSALRRSRLRRVSSSTVWWLCRECIRADLHRDVLSGGSVVFRTDHLYPHTHVPPYVPHMSMLPVRCALGGGA